jgi:hypothetical protein
MMPEWAVHAAYFLAGMATMLVWIGAGMLVFCGLGVADARREPVKLSALRRTCDTDPSLTARLN